MADAENLWPAGKRCAVVLTVVNADGGEERVMLDARGR